MYKCFANPRKERKPMINRVVIARAMEEQQAIEVKDGK